MKKILLFAFAALFFAACGGGSDIAVKYDGNAIPFQTKASWITTQEAIYGSSAQVSDQKHALRWLTIRNFEYNPQSALDSGGNPSADGQVKLFFSLHEDPGTRTDTPIKAATFSGANDGPMSLEFLNVWTFKNGKVETLPVSLASQTNRQTSAVKILSVTADAISGEIDITVKANGKDLTIKGPFTAKIFKAK